jgi:hypothetical protein
VGWRHSEIQSPYCTGVSRQNRLKMTVNKRV